jgi:hypothetical protein
MTPRNPKPNKTLQIARYLLAKGVAMDARQVYETGFRFSGDDVTTVEAISSLMHKMRLSAKYSIEQSLRGYFGNGTTQIKVIAISGDTTQRDVAVRDTRRDMWRMLLTMPVPQHV